MSIQTIVKEIAVADHLMDFSVEVRCDHYRLGLRAPRIEVVFENDKDSRRMPLHANTFGPVEGSEGAVSYHTCQYNLDVVFWDCQWKDCRIFLDIEYDGETYHQVPMLSEAGNSGRKNVITMEERQILLHIPEGIDSLDRMELSPIGAILACLLHLGTAFLGILLLPWFCLDVLGMLLLGTEYVEGEVKGSFLKRYIFYVSWRYFGFGRNKNGVAAATPSVY